MVSQRGGVGGAGRAIYINGLTPSYFSGGGGGGPDNSINQTAAGGIGGGGAGKLTTGDNGTSNTGGGGGGAGASSSANGGSGGSGIIIVRYPGSIIASAGGNTITSFTGDGVVGDDGVTQQVHTFTSSGSFSLAGVDLNERLKTTLTSVISGSGSLSYSGVGAVSYTHLTLPTKA